MRQSRTRDHKVLIAVRLPPVILTPSHFVRIGRWVRAGNVIVRADLGPAQPAEIGLGLIGANVLVHEHDRVIDPP